MNPVTARERKKKKGGEVSEMQKCKSMNDKEVSRNAVSGLRFRIVGMEVLGIRFRSSEWRYSG